MRVNESCAACLMDKQRRLTEDPDYLRAVQEIIDRRGENDSAPYLVYLFGLEYEKRFGPRQPYAAVKRKYNDLVLAREGAIREKIEASPDPLGAAFRYARIGNYIDFGAMNVVEDAVFLELLEQADQKEIDREVMASFLRQCGEAKRFLLLADNCGEIVLDKLFLEQLKKRFPRLELTVLVRGGEVLNDATEEDAVQSGIHRIARVIPSGSRVAGTVYGMLTEEARQALDTADVVLAKGQGNYETLSGQGFHVFYSFLCKCDYFTGRFGVPRLAGMFLEEKMVH